MPSAPQLDADYWEAAYANGADRWELGRATPPLARVMSERAVQESAIVLGCGRGNEVRLLAELGWPRVVGVDFAASAMREAKERTTDYRHVRAIEWRQADVFRVADADRHERFDVVVEHTCFCAIDRVRRDEWFRVVSSLLRPGGTLVALFYAHGRDGGPPFGATREELEAGVRAVGLVIERSEVPADSIERRRGDELLVIARAPNP